MDFSLSSAIHPTGEVRTPSWLVIIGAGSGGPQALGQILPHFPAGFPGTIIVVQNMRAGFSRVLAEQFDAVCPLPVREAIDGQIVRGSEIIFIPSGTVMSLHVHNEYGHHTMVLLEDDVAVEPGKQMPRIDSLMTSAAQISGRRTIGVLLTGLGTDGIDGMRSVGEAGGITIAQDEATCVVHDCPSAAISSGCVQQVLPLWNIAEGIIASISEVANADAA